MARAALNWTVRDLSEAAGLHRNTITNIEVGRYAGDPETLAKLEHGRKRYAVDKVNRILASANLTLEAVIAHTLPGNIDFIERIGRLIAGAEARRNAILREIDRHRESLARPLRRNLEQIEGEYQVVRAKSAEENNAA